MLQNSLGIPEPDRNAFIQHLAERLPAYIKTLALLDKDLLTLKANALTYNRLSGMTDPLSSNKPSPGRRKQGNINNGLLLVSTANVIPSIPTVLMVQGGILKWVDSFVHRIRSADGYTIAIGLDLGLVETAPETYEHESVSNPSLCREFNCFSLF